MSTTDKKMTSTEQLPGPEYDTERLLLERLKNSKTDEDYFRWMLFVVGFYRGINKIEAATELLNRFLETSDKGEEKAHCYLALGQIATDEQRLEAALNHFRSALSLEPKQKKIIYVLHNNIGYCLNMLGRFVEGEEHCRAAIQLNSIRASGYRNLGISLDGQGDLVGAAWALVEAVKADAADERARALLQKLLAEHPTIVVQCPWIGDGLVTDGAGPADAYIV
jgi:tetratricopeptide (TPR) repeat protein